MTWEPGFKPTTPCRPWGRVDDGGYARRWVKEKRRYIRIHRWLMALVLERELLPDEIVLHTCDNPSCVRFDHFHLGTRSDNQRDAAAKGRLPGNRDRTHCIHGHEFTVENTYLKSTSSGGVGRSCRTCKHESYLRRRTKLLGK